jgi:hypothetical protein
VRVRVTLGVVVFVEVNVKLGLTDGEAVTLEAMDAVAEAEAEGEGV